MSQIKLNNEANNKKGMKLPTIRDSYNLTLGTSEDLRQEFQRNKNLIYVSENLMRHFMNKEMNRHMSVALMFISFEVVRNDYASKIIDHIIKNKMALDVLKNNKKIHFMFHKFKKSIDPEIYIQNILNREKNIELPCQLEKDVVTSLSDMLWKLRNTGYVEQMRLYNQESTKGKVYKYFIDRYSPYNISKRTVRSYSTNFSDVNIVCHDLSYV